mgnify:FL=1
MVQGELLRFVAELSATLVCGGAGGSKVGIAVDEAIDEPGADGVAVPHIEGIEFRHAIKGFHLLDVAESHAEHGGEVDLAQLGRERIDDFSGLYGVHACMIQLARIPIQTLAKLESYGCVR